MIFYIIVAVVIISGVLAIGLRSGIEWKNNCGTGMGKKYMKEFGFEDDRKE